MVRHLKIMVSGLQKVGKYGGKGITAVGFASGMYTDISEDNKTVGSCCT